MDTKQLITSVFNRRSVRTFTGEAIDTETLAELERLLNQAHSEFRLTPLIEGTDQTFGTYGVIRRAACFIPLTVDASAQGAASDAATEAERIVLWLTAKGYGTCWMGATFHHKLDLEAGQRLAAVIAVGKAAAKPGLLSRITSALARSNTRRPFDDLFNVHPRSTYAEALELVRLAPSALNKQPWRAVETAAGVHFYRTEVSKMTDLDMGIARAHFELAAPAGHWAFLPETAPASKFKYWMTWLSD